MASEKLLQRPLELGRHLTQEPDLLIVQQRNRDTIFVQQPVARGFGKFYIGQKQRQVVDRIHRRQAAIHRLVKIAAEFFYFTDAAAFKVRLALAQLFCSLA